MTELAGQSGVITAVVEIIRKETGETETYVLMGTVAEEEDEA